MKLHDLLIEHFRLHETQKTALRKLGVSTVGNLLHHFPVRYGDTATMKQIGDLVHGEDAVIFGVINGLKTKKGFRSHIPMAEAHLSDESGSIKIVWFNQPYLAKMIGEGAFVRVEGKVSQKKSPATKTDSPESQAVAGELYLSNPKIETVVKLPLAVGNSLFGKEGESHTLYPVYPESRGLTSNWMYHALQKIFSQGILEEIHDPIPDAILKKYNLPSLKTALIWIHAPQKQEDATSARKRFAFEEVFFIQLEKKIEKRAWQKNPAFVIPKTSADIEPFIKRFPFEATDAQRKAIEIVLADFKKGYAMSRLLEGDVGSGKTAVAASTAYAVVSTSATDNKYRALQVAYMAPTEILAQQHFESFIEYFKHMPIQIGLITSSGCRKFPSKMNPSGWTNISRTQLLKWVASGEIAILIGTHSLIQKAVTFKNLAYVIIDEQHRFGTKQRQKLVRKDRIAPHLLSMTATPIPRTLALTIFGDLDLTLLDQMPHGRKPIITDIVLPNKREDMYEKVRTELQAGRQAYIICPRIDEPDPTKEASVIAKSVTEEAKRLKKSIFPEYAFGVLHGKLSPAEKDRIMLDFKAHKTTILVATSVVEVGVNVPNATVIVIEGAERFGLSQLHQLRGRVVRSNHQAYCFVFAETKSEKTIERLKALRDAKNGFELAEYDLQFRGPGALSGSKQWGITDIGMEAIKNMKMVEAARTEAEILIKKDATFASFPLISAELARREKIRIHFE